MFNPLLIHYGFYPFCYAINSSTLCIRAKTYKDSLDKIIIHYINLYDHSGNMLHKEMDIQLTDSLYAMYETAIQIKEKRFKYYFELIKASKSAFYTSDGLVKSPMTNNYFYFPFINDDDIISLPQWAEGEIIYQIIIDRFFDGNPDNNPEHVRPWGTLPNRSTYYGGDFEGIIKKLDYLADLGVKIIYLSPVFKSPSYHKYDISNFYQIEDIYGGIDGLKKLVHKVHEKGMKIVLDGVFNHCSSEHQFFQDLLLNNELSFFKDFFEVYSYPVSIEEGNYNNFGNLVPKMPKFNTSNDRVIDYLSEQAIYWLMELDIDGYRLDVADEISHKFWRYFRQTLKSKKKDIILIGEIWNKASAWLKGDELDTATNYKFRQYLFEFVKGEISSLKFINLIQANLMDYASVQSNYLVNLIGSHDTVRSITELNQEKTHYLTLMVMLLFPGMPLIYYGDEVGLEGDKDPDNRRAMLWKKSLSIDEILIRKLAKYRSQSDTLKKGATKFFATGDRVLCFKRTWNDESLLVVANFGEKIVSINMKDLELLMGNAAKTLTGYDIEVLEIALFKLDVPTKLENIKATGNDVKR